MNTPVSASTPMSAIKPTHTPMLMLYPRKYRNQMAPTAENGTAKTMIMVLVMDFVLMYSNMTIKNMVSGSTTVSFSRTRCMASYDRKSTRLNSSHANISY